jgi:hypothetical protein
MTFPRTSIATTGALLALGWAAPSLAQTYGPAGAGGLAGSVASSSSSNTDAYPGDGVRLSESALLHLGVTAEAGYDTNVFYTNNTNASATTNTGAKMFVVTPFADISNLPRTGGGPLQPFVYHLGLSLAYRQYVSEDPNIKAQTHLSPTASGSIAANGAKVSFSLIDTFSRIQEAPYGVPATTPTPPGGAGIGIAGTDQTTIRDHNVGTAQVAASPGGGRITSTLRYSNILEIFENDQLQFGDNMEHAGVFDVSWKWLPKTAFFLHLNGGYIHYLKTDPNAAMNPGTARSDSVPLGAGLGIRGLITPKLSGSVDLGYATSYYLDRHSHVSGVGNANIAVGLAYRLGFSTSLALGYNHGFRNSPIVGDYYNVDAVTLGVGQSIGGRLVLGLEGRYEWRRYQGLVVMMTPFERVDHVAYGQAKADFYIQKWLYAGIGYTISVNSSNFDQAPGFNQPGMVGVGFSGVDYVKHQILGRLGVTY